MNNNFILKDVKRIGTGLAFILFPLIFVFGFAVHPDLLHPHRLSDLQLILREHDNNLLALGHALILVDAIFLIIISLHFMKLLNHGKAAWAGFIGASLNIISAVALAAEKGAESLTISALDHLPGKEFAAIVPKLVPIFTHQGWMKLVMGVYFLAPGFTVLAIALFKTKFISLWQCGLLVIGIWLLGWPDGEEIFGVFGSILLAIALIPYGLNIITKRDRSSF